MGDNEAALLQLWRENAAKLARRTCQAIRPARALLPEKLSQLVTELGTGPILGRSSQTSNNGSVPTPR
jgi:hypothetical protein